jgi:3-hydroxyacyl-CoA dehydrogenase
VAENVTDGDLAGLRAAAVAFAERAVAEQMPLQKVRDRDDKIAAAKGDIELFTNFRRSIAKKARGFLAPEYNVRCIEAAANLPFDEGLEVEHQLFVELVTGAQSAAQRYAFFAERAANKIPDIGKDTPILEIET